MQRCRVTRAELKAAQEQQKADQLAKNSAKSARLRARLIEQGVIVTPADTEATTMPIAKTSTKILKIADQIRAVGRGLFSLASFVRKFEGQIKSIGLTEQEHAELTTTQGYPSARHYNDNRLPGTADEFGQVSKGTVRKEAVIAKAEKLAKQYDKIGQ